MKNFIQEGKILTVTAPAAVVSGDPVLVGKLLGIAATDAASGAAVEVQVEGVFEVAKLSTDVVAAGALLYWDNTNKRMTLTSTSNTKAGYATEAAGTGVALVKIKLTPGVG